MCLCASLRSHSIIDMILIPYCPAVTPPLFATYFQEKEGGGRNNEDLRFRLAVKPLPPTNLRTEINEALLCGRKTRTPSIDMPWQY